MKQLIRTYKDTLKTISKDIKSWETSTDIYYTAKRLRFLADKMDNTAESLKLGYEKPVIKKPKGGLNETN